MLDPSFCFVKLRRILMTPLLVLGSLMLFGPPKSAFAQTHMTDGNENVENSSPRNEESESYFQELKHRFFQEGYLDNGDWLRHKTIELISEIYPRPQDIEDFLVMVVIDKKNHSPTLRHKAYNSLLKVRGSIDPLAPILGGAPRNLWIQNLGIFLRLEYDLFVIKASRSCGSLLRWGQK